MVKRKNGWSPKVTKSVVCQRKSALLIVNLATVFFFFSFFLWYSDFFPLFLRPNINRKTCRTKKKKHFHRPPFNTDITTSIHNSSNLARRPSGTYPSRATNSIVIGFVSGFPYTASRAGLQPWYIYRDVWSDFSAKIKQKLPHGDFSCDGRAEAACRQTETFTCRDPDPWQRHQRRRLRLNVVICLCGECMWKPNVTLLPGSVSSVTTSGAVDPASV